MRFAGEITSLRIVPRAGAPAIEVTVTDGRGSAVAVFLGRAQGARHVARAGGWSWRACRCTRAARPLVYNPTYELLASSRADQTVPGRRIARAGEDLAHLVLGVRRHQREHLVAGLEHRLAARHHDVLARAGSRRSWPRGGVAVSAIELLDDRRVVGEGHLDEPGQAALEAQDLDELADAHRLLDHRGDQRAGSRRRGRRPSSR